MTNNLKTLFLALSLLIGGTAMAQQTPPDTLTIAATDTTQQTAPKSNTKPKNKTKKNKAATVALGTIVAITLLTFLLFNVRSAQ